MQPTMLGSQLEIAEGSGDRAHGTENRSANLCSLFSLLFLGTALGMNVWYSDEMMFELLKNVCLVQSKLELSLNYTKTELKQNRQNVAFIVRILMNNELTCIS